MCTATDIEILSLLEAKANPHLLVSNVNPPLMHIAAKHGADDIIRYLLDCGFNVDIEHEHDCRTNNDRPLGIAASYQHITTVLLLLDAKADINNNPRCDSCEWYLMGTCNHTALQSAVITNNVQLVQLLLEHKANPDVCYNSPLYYAVNNNNIAVAELLLKHKASTESQQYLQMQTNGLFPLACSISYEMTNLLLLYKPYMYKANEYPLYYAAKHGDLRTIQLLLDVKVDVQKEISGNNLLYYPVHKKAINTVALLLNAKANIQLNETVSIAVSQLDYSMIELLIEHKADVLAYNLKRRMQYTIHANHLPELRFLIEHKADPNFENVNLLSIAQNKAISPDGHHLISELLDLGCDEDGLQEPYKEQYKKRKQLAFLMLFKSKLSPAYRAFVQNILAEHYIVPLIFSYL